MVEQCFVTSIFHYCHNCRPRSGQNASRVESQSQNSRIPFAFCSVCSAFLQSIHLCSSLRKRRNWPEVRGNACWLSRSGFCSQSPIFIVAVGQAKQRACVDFMGFLQDKG